MSALLDSSVLIAALVEKERHHVECGELLDRPRTHIYAHALSEVYSILTGGRLGFRVSPATAIQLLEQSVLPNVSVITLTAAELIASIKQASSRGVRGGAIYDYLHLVAARKAKVSCLYTLDAGNFRTLHRAGDPEVRVLGEVH
jgi:predicted nucleic acid-binding protein